MKTLIELFDERPLENVLSTEVFKPRRTVFICPPEVAGNKNLQENMRAYFARRGVDTELEFMETSLLDADSVARHLERAVERYPDCALDIAGGTDAALFAGGLLCANKNIPVFTYSRRRNRFYNIRGASFANNMECNVQLSIEDCLLMAGGAMQTGRVDNDILKDYLNVIDPFFEVYLANRRDWTDIVTFIQRVSQGEKGGPVNLEVEGGYSQKGEHGAKVTADPIALKSLEDIGLIKDLQIKGHESVSFRFRDAQIRTWLRDVGSVLELYVYKACLETGLCQDVRTSVIVDWQGGYEQDKVTNEIDVMCSRGIVPTFISCKTCDVKTEALNELAILRDRFGGELAKAVIVTAENGRSAMRHRAEELRINVIDIDDLDSGMLKERIAEIIK